MTNCPECGAENRPGARFCAQCGTMLAIVCGACGAAAQPGDRFCASCGGPLPGATTDGSPPPAGGDLAAASAPAVSERRLVTVLFADLVGFTTLSEHRDPEEVRDLLSRYFERCRALIERYGGVVEKFIGDAVMAMWGTPVAREDDAERAVRAALSLTAAVTLLGEEVGMPELRVRAGVLTGTAAVEIGAEGEGMVLGDTVNTASRLQSIAKPGTVLVDDVTRRSSDAAVEYEDAGSHQVKGREQAVRAWTALRVVAQAGGARRSTGPEAPFVGRDRELERIVAAAEASAGEGRAGLVALVGEAGTGKSRLLWEYEKVVDGAQRMVKWHRGRCLSYGDGVAFWALAEIVRGRAGIAEDERPEAARAKLRETVERYVPEERERRLVEPRLLHLLGLEQRTASDRTDLFSGWRLFFERLSEDAPVVLVLEDVQWADSGLLEFVDYLLEWSADRPIFILACGRPELLERRPGWGREAVTLDRLSDEVLGTLLAGLVPGLPDDLTRRILQRAEGVPLYAVETVRMLLDRGLLVAEGGRYVPAGDVSELAVPETLQALAAARLDALNLVERSVLQDAAVLGQSFTAIGVAAVSGRPGEEIDRVLAALVSKQMVGIDDDPLSAEQGQHHFLQGLIRNTAYGTLSRRDRKARHLAAARYLQETASETAVELAEVLAAHFLDAAAADPDAADVARIRASARGTLEDAGRRALSLALAAEAGRAFDRAAELAEDELTRAGLLEQAGQAALLDADYEGAIMRLSAAITVYDTHEHTETAAHARIDLARAMEAADRLDEAIALLRATAQALPDESVERADALAQLAINLVHRREDEPAQAAADACLQIAEAVERWPTITTAFTALSRVRRDQGRPQEARAFQERALQIALDHELATEALRGFIYLADGSLQQDRYRETLELAERGRALAEQRGDRRSQRFLVLNASTARLGLGEWDEIDPADLEATDYVACGMWLPWARIHAARGEHGALRAILTAAQAHPSIQRSDFTDTLALTQAIALHALGDDGAALALALPIATGPETLNEDRREALTDAGLAALALGDQDAVEQIIATVAALPLAQRAPLLRAGAARLSGLLAHRRDDPEQADAALEDAARTLDGVDAPFALAQILIERAEILHALRRPTDAAPLVAQAVTILQRLRATPWLERAQLLVVNRSTSHLSSPDPATEPAA